MKEKKIFYCLDKVDQFGNEINMTMYGNWDSGVARGLSITYRPCVPK